ncbi:MULTISPECIES: HAD-IA family hydrolase [Actinosynnema]|uniref:HAD family hydrolase n=1 Tax=Actinosynnema TaxID=40566 RepID=UPI0020A33929|nr:HAD-IA family hydrolase [Actinosynnema pretiosum]MCP2098085.1 putative hydrolase of the HAD superfamily [Actinosynnema pretiosum]
MTTSDRATRFRGVVFDLFGTLVDAPTRQERHNHARDLAHALGAPEETLTRALSTSWRARHLGHWSSVAQITDGLARMCNAGHPDLSQATRLLAETGHRRLAVAPTVLAVLEQLTGQGIRVAVLSDAAAETAQAWPECPLAAVPALFSCREGVSKPSPDLYQRVLDRLRLSPEEVLYCGDGGGDELAGADRAGMTAVRVQVRGGPDALIHHKGTWNGPCLRQVEELPGLVLDTCSTRAA